MNELRGATDRPNLPCCLCVLLGVGCGGTAVIDGAGGGATTSPTSTSSATVTSSTTSSTTVTSTGPLTCDELFADYSATLERATYCDTCDDGPDPCGHTAQYVADSCGCPVAVNVQAPQALADAVAAYLAWTDAGCGPYDCGTPCVISSEPSCAPSGTGCDGMCAY